MQFASKILTPTVALVLVWLNACSSTSELTVVTEPPGAMVFVADAGGATVKENAAPITMGVTFSQENPRYTIVAKPPESKADEFLETSRVLNANDYEALPQVTSSNRQILVKLDEAEFRPDVQILITPEPGKGWIGVVNKVRSFIDTTERSGAVPTRVVELERAEIGISGLSLSPDGRRIAFAVSSLDIDTSELPALAEGGLDGHGEFSLKDANLRGVRVTGGGIQHITTEDFKDLDPAFSSDGRHLIFSSNRRRPQSNDILRISADGRSGIADIYVDRRDQSAVSPSMAADGTIAFALYPSDWTGPKDTQIWTVGGGNAFPTQVASGMHPRISPDGRHIAYIGIDGNVWVVGSDGRRATQLTQGAEAILTRFKAQLAGDELALFEDAEKRGQLLRRYGPYSHPSWGSDSERIIYTSMEGNDPTGRPNQDVWIMNRDGSSLQQLTTNGSVDWFPVMSSDQQYIYFISNRGLRWAIWRISAPRS